MARPKGARNKRKAPKPKKDRTKVAPTPKSLAKNDPIKSNGHRALDMIDDLVISSGALKVVAKEKRPDVLSVFGFLENELNRLAEYDKDKKDGNTP